MFTVNSTPASGPAAGDSGALVAILRPLYIHRLASDGAPAPTTRFIASMVKTLVILLSCTATARACESPDQEGGRGKATITGGIAGAAVLPTFLLAIGLTPAGPVAGGWFAASQGAGVAAGSWMASWQSMAMFGSLAKSLTVGAGFAATGAGAGALTASKAEIDVRSLTRKIAGTTVAGARAAAAYTSRVTSDKATKIHSYASDTLRGD